MTDPTLFETHAETFSVDLGMYYCGRRIGTKNHVYGPEIRSHFLMVLVEKGTAILYRDGKELPLGTHDVLVMFPGEKIHYRALTDWTIKWVGVDGSRVEELFGALGVTRAHPIFKPQRYETAARLIDALCDTKYDSSVAVTYRLQSLLCELFATLLSDTARETASDPILSAIEIIKYNYSRELNIKQLADSLFLNSAYFSRLFKKRTGMSPKKYILQTRMTRAKELLSTTDCSIKEISVTVGYGDPLYFSKLFYKTERITPSGYRQQYTKKRRLIEEAPKQER